MFILGNLIHAIASIFDTILNLYMWVIIISALISWVNPDPYNPIVKFLHSITDPVLTPIRRKLGFAMGLDISPMIVILAIMFVRSFIVATLFDIAVRMK